MYPGQAGGPPPVANNAGGNHATCPICPSPNGMPRWWVDEPYINLWITNEPLSYFTSSGGRMTFRWYYRQRYMLPLGDEIPNLYNVGGPSVRVGVTGINPYQSDMRSYGMTNAGWSHNWMMDLLVWDRDWESKDITYQNANPPYRPGYEALLFRPEGGMYYFTSNNFSGINLTEAQSKARLLPMSGLAYPLANGLAGKDTNGICWGDSGMGFKLAYPDGSQDIFGLACYLTLTNSYGTPAYSNSTAHAFLTQRTDPQGRATLLGYEYIPFTNRYNNPYQPAYSAYRLRYVVDPDGKTNRFLYNTNTSTSPYFPPYAPRHAWELAEVDDAYGRKATFTYGAPNTVTAGVLTSITDAATKSSSFGYPGNPSGWITNLTTPYGVTTFSFLEVPDDNSVRGFSQRATYVSEPEGAHQLFYYLHKSSLLPTTAAAPIVPPGQLPFDAGTNGTSGHATLDYRNSFHWDQRQFATLSSGVVSQLGSNLTNALASLSLQDLRKGRLKHWLLGADSLSITESLSSQRDPSPDAGGQSEGPRTWYNYTWKYGTPEYEGDALVSCIARLLPDNTSQYATYQYQSWFGGWEDHRSYSLPNGTVGELTNLFYYDANNIDLLSVSNSLGQWATFAYDAHLPVSITDAQSQVTSLSWFGPLLTGVETRAAPASTWLSISTATGRTGPTTTG